MTKLKAHQARHIEELEVLQEGKQAAEKALLESRTTHTNALVSQKEIHNDLRSEIYALQNRLDSAKADLESQRMSTYARSEFNSPRKQTNEEDAFEDEPETPPGSPPLSPIKGTPHRNATLESETLKGTLFYNQAKMLRQRKELEKEKTQRLQLQLQVKDLEIELETLRQLHGSRAPKRRAVRGPVATSKMKSRPNEVFLAGRRPISEITDVTDDNWEDDQPGRLEAEDLGTLLQRGSAISGSHSASGAPDHDNDSDQSDVLSEITPDRRRRSNSVAYNGDYTDEDTNRSMRSGSPVSLQWSRASSPAALYHNTIYNQNDSAVFDKPLALDAELRDITPVASPGARSYISGNTPRADRPAVRYCDMSTMTDEPWPLLSSVAHEVLPETSNHGFQREFIMEDPSNYSINSDLSNSTRMAGSLESINENIPVEELEPEVDLRAQSVAEKARDIFKNEKAPAAISFDNAVNLSSPVSSVVQAPACRTNARDATDPSNRSDDLIDPSVAFLGGAGKILSGANNDPTNGDRETTVSRPGSAQAHISVCDEVLTSLHDIPIMHQDVPLAAENSQVLSKCEAVDAVLDHAKAVEILDASSGMQHITMPTTTAAQIEGEEFEIHELLYTPQAREAEEPIGEELRMEGPSRSANHADLVALPEFEHPPIVKTPEVSPFTCGANSWLFTNPAPQRALDVKEQNLEPFVSITESRLEELEASERTLLSSQTIIARLNNEKAELLEALKQKAIQGPLTSPIETTASAEVDSTNEVDALTVSLLQPSTKAVAFENGVDPLSVSETEDALESDMELPSSQTVQRLRAQRSLRGSPTAKAEKVLGKDPARTVTSSTSISKSLRSRNSHEGLEKTINFGMAPPIGPSTARDTIRGRQQKPLLSDAHNIENDFGYNTSRAQFGTSRMGPTRSDSHRSISSLSSFASELDDRFNSRFGMPESRPSAESPTDPSTIESITRTMIGMSMYKYTRRAGRQGLSENRHKRYFWIHPYTKTLYWSVYNPVSAPEGAVIKSAAILAVNIEDDFNTNPPGLHQRSICIGTARRVLKLTALQSADHEDWVRSLDFLLYGPGPEDQSLEAARETAAIIRDFSPTRNPGRKTNSADSPNKFDSQRTVLAAATAERSPKQDDAQSISGKFGSLFSRSRGSRSEAKPRHDSISSRKSFSLTDGTRHQDGLTLDDIADSLGLEDVRSCCGGRHNVSELCHRPSTSRASSHHRA